MRAAPLAAALFLATACGADTGVPLSSVDAGPSDASTPNCGTSHCDVPREYCRVDLLSSHYTCAVVPPVCASDDSCACVAPVVRISACVEYRCETGDGGIPMVMCAEG